MLNRNTEIVNAVAVENKAAEAPEKRVMTFPKAVFIYLLAGLVGTVWETFWHFVNGRGFVYSNGSIFTPFNLVYGIGGLVIILALRNRTKVWQVYLIGSIGGGVVEYVLSFLEELVLGTRSWDYSGKFLNINGRTTVIYMAFWGLLCVTVIFLVYRPLDKLLDSIPPKVMMTIAIIMTVIVALDLMVTVGALIRYAARNVGSQPLTYIGTLIDRIFNDDFMARHFPNMQFK